MGASKMVKKIATCFSVEKDGYEGKKEIIFLQQIVLIFGVH